MTCYTDAQFSATCWQTCVTLYHFGIGTVAVLVLIFVILIYRRVK